MFARIFLVPKKKRKKKDKKSSKYLPDTYTGRVSRSDGLLFSVG